MKRGLPRDWEQRSRAHYWRANAKSDVCAFCGGKLKKLVIRTYVQYGDGLGPSVFLTPACTQCVSFHESWLEAARPCQGDCGRDVVIIDERVRKFTACSRRCYEIAKGVKHSHYYDNYSDTHICDHCGEEFAAQTRKRADARYCSNACRQAAYRDRAK